MKDLAGKYAVVTGAASGIGLATAHALADAGCDLCLVDIDREGLEDAKALLETKGRQVSTHACDLADGQAIETVCDEILAGNDPDILINNAGVLYYDAFEAMTSEQWDRVLGVNLTAPARLIRCLLPSMKQKSESHIVNVSSVLGLTPKRKMAGYCTSKYGLNGLSLALRAELSPRVGVSLVCPGLTKSNLYSSARAQGRSTSGRKQPDYLSASPELVARRIVGAIRHNKRLVVVTHHARAARLAHGCVPGLLDLLQMKRNRKRQSVAPSTS